MKRDIDLSIREIDNLLQHLYIKLKGRKEGLSLAEPASILLSVLKRDNPAFYEPQLALFTPIIMDTLISRAYVSFGYEGLQSLNDIAGDTSLATGDYIPSGVQEGLSEIREEIEAIESTLAGDDTGPEEDETRARGFIRERASASAGIPLVSTYNTGGTPFSTSRVVRARVEVRLTGEWSIRNRHEPVISFDHISAEPNSEFETQIRTAVTAAERFAVRKMGLRGLPRLPREYRISLPEIASFPASAIQRLSGGSAGLAVAALLVSAISRLDLCRHRLVILPGTAFTGTVEENGNIIAVEDSHIAEKTRAVHYSRSSGLALPSPNLQTAQKEQDELNLQHPARKIDVTPADDIAELFENRSVILKSIVPFGKPLIQRFFLWRKHLFAAASLIALALITLLVARPYFSRDIADVSIEHDRITIINEFGRQITEYNLDFPFYKGKNPTRRVFVDDFDGDRRNEALCVLSDSRYQNPSSRFNRMHFLSFDNEGRYRFRFILDCEEMLDDQILPGERDFPIGINRDSGIFRDHNGKKRFLAITHHASRKPAAVLNLSLEDFSSQIFLHEGYLHNMALNDVDDDGIDDIVLSGYNNALGSCVLVVLDQRQMNGTSPEGANYELEGFEDIAKYYVTFPDFYRYIPFDKNDWLPLTPKVKNTKDGLTFTVRNYGNDVNFYLQSGLECVRAEVLPSPDEKGTSSSARSTPFGYPGKAGDELTLKQGIRYWDGDGWSPEPVANGNYFAYTGWSLDSTIVKVLHEGESLVMNNRHGIEVARHDIGFRTSDHSSYMKTFFGDYLDGSGDEIVCTMINSKFPEIAGSEPNKIYAFVFSHSGELINRFIYNEADLLGDRIGRVAKRNSFQFIGSAYQNRAQFRHTASRFRDRLKHENIYLLTHHKTEPPSSLIRFSPEEGSFETFFHKGILTQMIPRDVDGDGISELLLTGYNSDLDAPVIIALDPDRVKGSSPLGNCYDISGEYGDVAKYYLKLPEYKRFERYASRFYPLHIYILENSDILRILVRSRTESVVYTFTDDLVVADTKVVIGTRDENRDLVLNDADIDGIEKDESDLADGVRYWEGEVWTSVSTVNRSYLKSIRKGD